MMLMQSSKLLPPESGRMGRYVAWTIPNGGAEWPITPAGPDGWLVTMDDGRTATLDDRGAAELLASIPALLELAAGSSHHCAPLGRCLAGASRLAESLDLSEIGHMVQRAVSHVAELPPVAAEELSTRR